MATLGMPGRPLPGFPVEGGAVAKPPPRSPMPAPGGGDVMKLPPRPGMPSQPPPMAPKPPTPMPAAPSGGGGGNPGREYWEPSAEERADFLKNNPGDEGRIKEAFSRERQPAAAAPPRPPVAPPAATAQKAAAPLPMPPPPAPSMQALGAPAGGGSLLPPPDPAGGAGGGGQPVEMTPENPAAMQSAMAMNLNPNLGRRILPASMRALAQAGAPLY